MGTVDGVVIYMGGGGVRSGVDVVVVRGVGVNDVDAVSCHALPCGWLRSGDSSLSYTRMVKQTNKQTNTQNSLVGAPGDGGGQAPGPHAGGQGR